MSKFTKFYIAYWVWRLPIKHWKIEKARMRSYSRGGMRWAFELTLNDGRMFKTSDHSYGYSSAQLAAEEMVKTAKKALRQVKRAEERSTFEGGTRDE